MPTVSYRPNTLGVNIDLGSDSSNNVLVINETDGKNYLIFRGVTTAGARDASLNLTTGALDNFIIDGGTWNS